VDNGDDCDDTMWQYEDWDGDGFGSTTPTACGADNDLDCDDAVFTYEDFDGDGFGNPMVLVPCGVLDNTDCDDTDNAVGSGTINEYFIDNDGDGFGSWDAVAYACTPPAGYVDNSDDCDDFSFTYEDLDGDGFGNAAVYAPCGSYDNTDCDDNLVTHMDFDGDGFGDPNVLVPCGGVTDSTDCDDNDAGVGAGAMTAYYTDNDLDGWGDMWGTPFWSCSPVAGMVDNNDDCDDWSITYEDLDADGYGSTVQVPCGAYDNTDCDDNLHYFNDNDGDGFGDPNFYVPCAGVLDSTDCDDYDIAVGSGTMEAWYFDGDADGYGMEGWMVWSCFPVPGMVNNSDDCDDFNFDVNPGAMEISGNGIDDDCDSLIDEGVAGIIEEELSFSVYPNPAGDVVNLKWSFENDESGEVEILSLNGQIVYRENFEAGDSHLIIETNQLEPGLYYVSLISDGVHLTKTLVIQ
jgi:hypothetical protein